MLGGEAETKLLLNFVIVTAKFVGYDFVFLVVSTYGLLENEYGVPTEVQYALIILLKFDIAILSPPFSYWR